MNLQNQFNGLIDNKISKCENTRVLLQYLPEFPDAKLDHVYLDYKDSFGICFPYDFEIINTMRKFFVDAGWKLVSEDDSTELGTARKWLHFNLSDENEKVIVQVVLFFGSYIEGTTCRVQKIGPKTITQDVYEVVCQDGAFDWGA